MNYMNHLIKTLKIVILGRRAVYKTLSELWSWADVSIKQYFETQQTCCWHESKISWINMYVFTTLKHFCSLNYLFKTVAIIQIQTGSLIRSNSEYSAFGNYSTPNWTIVSAPDEVSQVQSVSSKLKIQQIGSSSRWPGQTCRSFRLRVRQMIWSVYKLRQIQHDFNSLFQLQIKLTK